LQSPPAVCNGLLVRHTPGVTGSAAWKFSWSVATMRLRREMIQYLAQAIARDLIDKGLIQALGDRAKVEDLLREVITEELQIEDRLNDEVKNLLRAFSNEFSKGEADYHKMFTMVKRKLAQERGLIL
jgi:hypothetical protein